MHAALKNQRGKLLDQYDTNWDGKLDAAEREEAAVSALQAKKR